MAVDKRLGAVFVSGLLLGAAAVAKVRRQAGRTLAPQPDLPEVKAPTPQSVAAQPAIRFPRTLPEFEFGPDTPEPSRSPAEPEQLAAPKSRYLGVFAVFFVLAALGLTAAWMGLTPASWSLNDKFSIPGLASGPTAPDGLALNACPLQPAIAAAGEKDGQFPLQADVVGLTAADIGSFLVIGKQSAAAGRPHDAEVAFLMACRVADKIKGSSSIESADARYQLGTHYRALALAGTMPPGPDRAELLQRAEGLYTDSLPAYVTKYGQSGEMPKQAGEGLSAVRLALAQPQLTPMPKPLSPLPQTLANQARPAFDDPSTPSPVSKAPEPMARPDESAPAPGQSPVSKPAPRNVDTDVAKVIPEAPQTSQYPGTSGGTGPSFDCRRARSTTEKMICSDAELARLDRELGRAYGRAKNATADPAAFRRQSELEWRRRETMCQDRGCLLRWYAYRRAQLVSVIDGREPGQPAELR